MPSWPPFFLDQAVPIPSSTARAVDFLADIEPALASAFWDAQLSAVAALVQDSPPTEASWRDLTPSDIRPAAGKINLEASLSLMTQCGLGGRRRCRQFIFGVELVGELSQERVSPMDSRTSHRRPEPDRELFESDSMRSQGISAASGGWSFFGKMPSIR